MWEVLHPHRWTSWIHFFWRLLPKELLVWPVDIVQTVAALFKSNPPGLIVQISCKEPLPGPGCCAVWVPLQHWVLGKGRSFLIRGGSSLYLNKVTSVDATLVLAACLPGSSSQTQACGHISPLPASLMSREPVDTVNKPCEARQCPCFPWDTVATSPKTTLSCQWEHKCWAFPRLRNQTRWSAGTSVFELHTDTHAWRHSSHMKPWYCTIHSSIFLFFIASLSSLWMWLVRTWPFIDHIAGRMYSAYLRCYVEAQSGEASLGSRSNCLAGCCWGLQAWGSSSSAPVPGGILTLEMPMAWPEQLCTGTAANRYLSLVTRHIRSKVLPKLSLLAPLIDSGPWIFFSLFFSPSPDAIRWSNISLKPFLWTWSFCCEHKESVSNE